MKAFVTDVKQPETFVPKKVEIILESELEYAVLKTWMKVQADEAWSPHRGPMARIIYNALTF